MRGYCVFRIVWPPHNSFKSDYNVERTGSDFSNNSRPDRLFTQGAVCKRIPMLVFLGNLFRSSYGIELYQRLVTTFLGMRCFAS